MASLYADVSCIGKKIEGVIHGSKPMSDALELLDALSAFPVDVGVLSETRIGITVNRLRKKTSDERVSRKAKALIKEWRDVIEKKPRWFHSTLKEGLPHGTGSAQSLSNDNDLRDSIPAGAHMQAPGPSKRSTNNEVRNKCVEMLLKALQSGVLPNGAISPKDVAVRIESKIFQVNGDTGSKYMSAVRSRVFNLRDKKNPTLLENVLTGVVEPERFALMTVEEMASDEMRRQRASFTEQAIKEHEMPMQEGTASDMFKCDNCHKKNCTYSQMQTRSADEPMTIFVFCRECGSRWKLH